VGAVGDSGAQLGGVDYPDVWAERKHIDDGALDGVEAKGGVEPTVIGSGLVASDAYRLESSKHCSQAEPFGRYVDVGTAWAPGPAGDGLPLVRVGEFGQVVLQQLKPPTGTAGGVHRNPGARELLDVTQHGAFAHLQFGGEVGGRDPSTALKDQH
jgi:hypothetical protein